MAHVTKRFKQLAGAVWRVISARRRAILALLVGTLLGLTCRHLPVDYQAACKLAARLAHLFAG